jgi:hypothetical protein
MKPRGILDGLVVNQCAITWGDSCHTLFKTKLRRHVGEENPIMVYVDREDLCALSHCVNVPVAITVLKDLAQLVEQAYALSTMEIVKLKKPLLINNAKLLKDLCARFRVRISIRPEDILITGLPEGRENVIAELRNILKSRKTDTEKLRVKYSIIYQMLQWEEYRLSL